MYINFFSSGVAIGVIVSIVMELLKWFCKLSNIGLTKLQKRAWVAIFSLLATLLYAAETEMLHWRDFKEVFAFAVFILVVSFGVYKTVLRKTDKKRLPVPTPFTSS